MTVLVLGSRGQAGTEFMSLAAAAGLSLLAPSREEFDVRDAGQLGRMVDAANPSWIANFTAFHVLEACETDFMRALEMNAAAVRDMAIAAERVEARFLTVSTDYVFDGAQREPYGEDDPARPIQAYGISKRCGELAALAAAPERTYVIRTCGLYGRAGSRERSGNFVEKRLADARSHRRLRVGADLICTPTSARAFAAAILALMRAEEAQPGIYHLTAEGACSWAQFTQEILRLAGSPCVVDPVDRRGDYGPVRRPAYSVLANRRAAKLGIRLPDWRADLADYFRMGH